MTINLSQNTLTLVSRSTTSPGSSASTQLMPANPGRHYVLIKAPETADLWFNPLGGTAGVNLADCYKVISGGTYESYTTAWTAAITYYTVGTGVQVNAAEA